MEKGGDMRFAGRGGGGGGGRAAKRRRTDVAHEELNIVVRANGRPESTENTVALAVHKLDDYSMEGILEAAGKKLYDGAAAACLYHEDGIVATTLSLLKEGEVLYSAGSEHDGFVGCLAGGHAGGGGADAVVASEAAKREVARQAVLNSKAEFVPCTEFVGAKEGYFFAQLDAKEGLGYHRDLWGADSATVKKAELNDILDKYGGGEYLGRSRDLHSLYAKPDATARSCYNDPVPAFGTARSGGGSASGSVSPTPAAPQEKKAKEERARASAAAAAALLQAAAQKAGGGGGEEEEGGAESGFHKKRGTKRASQAEAKEAPAGLAEAEEPVVVWCFFVFCFFLVFFYHSPHRKDERRCRSGHASVPRRRKKVSRTISRTKQMGTSKRLLPLRCPHK